MERLSNSYEELMNQVQQEVQNIEFNEDENLLTKYSEISWFPGVQFCISVIAETKKTTSNL